MAGRIAAFFDLDKTILARSSSFAFARPFYGRRTAIVADDVGMQVVATCSSLYVEGDIADTDEGRNAYALLKVGALSGMSIGYCVPDGCCELVKAPDGTTVFQITSVDLWEVSLVTFPMNDAARVESVKYAGPSMTVREFEKFLRDAGNFSASQAKAIGCLPTNPPKVSSSR